MQAGQGWTVKDFNPPAHLLYVLGCLGTPSPTDKGSLGNTLLIP